MLNLMVVKRRRSSAWQFIILAVLIGGLFLIKYNAQAGLFLLGCLAIVVSFYIEYHSAKIWRSYKRNYQPSRNKLMTTLTKPREIYHTINVYILWPVIFALGCWAIYSSMQL